MIEIFRLSDGRYRFAAGIYRDDASVAGSSTFADYIRSRFERMRDQGYEPADHMDKVEAEVRDAFSNGYYYVS